jgi:hypothetical protein
LAGFVIRPDSSDLSPQRHRGNDVVSLEWRKERPLDFDPTFGSTMNNRALNRQLVSTQTSWTSKPAEGGSSTHGIGVASGVRLVAGAGAIEHGRVVVDGIL